MMMRQVAARIRSAGGSMMRNEHTGFEVKKLNETSSASQPIEALSCVL